ncbi:Flp family type IVb pilin [Rosenbergiella nectarea subsp. apis]|nr:Flp family type IVb pilin [Rosenbergiella nectarea subsp. apis]
MMYGVVYSQNFISDGLNKFKQKLSKEDGVTAIEYAVIAVAISGLLLAVFGSGEKSFITEITKKFELLTSNIKGTVN